MKNVKNKVEALLYAVGNRISEQDLAMMGNEKVEDIRQALKELQHDYDSRDNALMITHDEGFWKLTVRQDYLGLVSGLVKKTELDHATMETLALVAYKHPALQSDIIQMRSSVAYEHLKQLEELGFITRTQKGRTKVIRLTDRFYDYFDINENERSQFFETVKAQDQQIQNSLKEIKEKEESVKEQMKESAQHDHAFAFSDQAHETGDSGEAIASQESQEAKETSETSETSEASEAIETLESEDSEQPEGSGEENLDDIEDYPKHSEAEALKPSHEEKSVLHEQKQN